MDRSYSYVTTRRSNPEPPKKRARRIYRPVATAPSEFIYRCIKCDAAVDISHIILCACGSRVVRKEKTKKEQTFVCR